MRKIAIMAAAAFLLATADARAIVIAPTDYDAWDDVQGGLHSGPLTDDFITFNGTDIGNLENLVFLTQDPQGGDLYTYVHTVTPGINNISEFNTGFPWLGATGIVGWSFSDSGAAGGTGTAADFTVDVDVDDMTIDWSTNFQQNLSSGFDAGESITFFFVSTLPPHLGTYNLIDGQTGTGTSFAPVPEPGTMALIGSGLLGLVARRRRQARQSQ
jgi:hypothetical protein